MGKDQMPNFKTLTNCRFLFVYCLFITNVAKSGCIFSVNIFKLHFQPSSDSFLIGK